MTKTPKKRIHRFLIEQFKESGQVIDLSDDLMHYASRVLRLLDGSEIQVWNGDGQVFPARIDYLSKKQAQVTSVGPALALRNTELLRNIYIAQALPESDKMDWVLEKCTEMGARGFLPIQAERSVVKLNAERAQKRQQHWLKVISSAGIQCERQVLPSLGEVKNLTQTLESLSDWPNKPTTLLFTPEASINLTHWLDLQTQGQSDQPIVVLIGPEGGWSEAEIREATAHGAQAIGFSPRVLRTETFGLACLSQLVLGLQLEDKGLS